MAERWDLFWDECHEGVTRKGQFEPCNKQAVAVRYDRTEGDATYPVCVKHARRPMVPLYRLAALASPAADDDTGSAS